MADQEYEQAVNDLRNEFSRLKNDVVTGILDRRVGPRDVPFWLYASDTKTTVENQEQKLIRVEQRLDQLDAKLDQLLAAVAAK